MLPFLAVGVGLSAIGAVTNIAGSIFGGDANKDAIRAQQEAENARHQAMKLDADRRRRSIIRDAIIARSQALAVSNAQGASKSSSLQSAYGQIQGTAAFGYEQVNNSERLGEQLFTANQHLLAARQREADATTMKSIGSSISSLGGAILGNLGPINNVLGSSSITGDRQVGNAYPTGSTGGSLFNG